MKLWLLLGIVVLTFSLSAMSYGDGPRVQKTTNYDYSTFAKWLLGAVQPLQERPAHFYIVFDCTDSVRGKGPEADVLPLVWQRDLLGMLLSEFMVEMPAEHEGDRLSMLAYGRQKVVPIEGNITYRRDGISKLKAEYPVPYTNTPPDKEGTDLNDVFHDIIQRMEKASKAENAILILITDDIPQGEGANVPSEAKLYRTFRAWLSPGRSRLFSVYLSWNDFPSRVVFAETDPSTGNTKPCPRDKIAEQQKNMGGPVDNQRTIDPLEEQRKDGLRLLGYLAAGLIIFLALWAWLLNWYRAHYKVRFNGSDRIVWVFPGRRSSKLDVANPNYSNELIGTLRGSGLPGFFRLVLQPSSNYHLTDSRSVASDGGTKTTGRRGRAKAGSSLVLCAGSKTMADNVISFRAAKEAASASDSITPGPSQGQINIKAQQRQGLQLWRKSGK